MFAENSNICRDQIKEESKCEPFVSFCPAVEIDQWKFEDSPALAKYVQRAEWPS